MTESFQGHDKRAPAAARLESPAFRRNGEPILAVLRDLLDERTGNVLEIGSGPGQHIAAFAAAMPALTWWPTDPDPVHLASIAAWREDGGWSNLRRPVALDAAARDWPLGGPDDPPDRNLAAILCINVVHIAPWPVAEGVLRKAGRLLSPDGRLILYGPYSRDGVHTAASNAAFDAALKAQNPGWGVRDTADIIALAGTGGLSLTDTVEMPSNNLCLILGPLARRARQSKKPT